MLTRVLMQCFKAMRATKSNHLVMNSIAIPPRFIKKPSNQTFLYLKKNGFKNIFMRSYSTNTQEVKLHNSGASL